MNENLTQNILMLQNQIEANFNNEEEEEDDSLEHTDLGDLLEYESSSEDGESQADEASDLGSDLWLFINTL